MKRSVIMLVMAALVVLFASEAFAKKQTQTYTIKRGDNLWKLTRNGAPLDNCTIDELIEQNPIIEEQGDRRTIFKGQTFTCTYDDGIKEVKTVKTDNTEKPAEEAAKIEDKKPVISSVTDTSSVKPAADDKVAEESVDSNNEGIEATDSDTSDALVAEVDGTEDGIPNGFTGIISHFTRNVWVKGWSGAIASTLLILIVGVLAVLHHYFDYTKPADFLVSFLDKAWSMLNEWIMLFGFIVLQAIGIVCYAIMIELDFTRASGDFFGTLLILFMVQIVVATLLFAMAFITSKYLDNERASYMFGEATLGVLGLFLVIVLGSVLYPLGGAFLETHHYTLVGFLTPMSVLVMGYMVYEGSCLVGAMVKDDFRRSQPRPPLAQEWIKQQRRR